MKKNALNKILLVSAMFLSFGSESVQAASVVPEAPIGTSQLAPPAPKIKCGVNSFAVHDSCGPGVFRTMSTICYDGFTVNDGGPTSCKSSQTWVIYANQYCAKHCK